MYFDRDTGALSTDVDRVSAEVKKLLAWLGESGARTPAAEYTPLIDVSERPDAIDIVADVPGVPREAIRIVFTAGAIVIAGRKAAPVCDQREAAFHFAERTFGLFARVIQIGGAVDPSRARATLGDGELHVRLPRVDERRGRDVIIAIESV